MNDRLRIGDADRESAARELGEHFAFGRITAEEHAERLDQIWAARTAADLSPAFRDLPRPRASHQVSRPTTTSKTVRRDRGWEMPRVPFPFKVLVAIVAIWWGFHHPLFLLIAAIVWFVFVRRLVRRRWRHGRSGPWDWHHYSADWH